jgi:trimethylamine---corrinoid protein Co-methyltransferase
MIECSVGNQAIKFCPYPFDMKYGTIVYGSAEYVLMTLIQMQIAEYYGLPKVDKSLSTMGKMPDSQSAAEKMAHTVIASLAGAESFTNAGMLSIDEIYSPVQVVIDMEIMNYVRRITDGYEFSEESISSQTIEDVVSCKCHFLEHESTFENYKSMFLMPELFEHKTMDQWNNQGRKSIVNVAREIAKKNISEHSFELSREKQKELDRIYTHACVSLNS